MIQRLAADAGGDVASVLNAAKTGKPVSWIVSMGAHAGDRALFHLPACGLAARGVIGTEPRDHGQGRYRATVRKIALLAPAVPLAFLRKNHRSWKWPTYPKGYTTIDGRIEARLEELLNRYQKEKLKGVSKSAPVTRYERNRKAWQECIAYYGKSCYGCGISFGKTYGETAEEYIQVHHLKAVRKRRRIRGRSDQGPSTDLPELSCGCASSNPLNILKLQRMLKGAARS
jgi:hypothetical protein